MREHTAPQVQPVYQRLRAELWTYRHPDPEAAAIAGHAGAAGQPGAQTIVDGTPEGQP